LQNITQLASRTKLNKIAKYHKIGIKNQTKQDCKISQNWYQESNLTRLQNNAPKQKKIKPAKIK